MSVKISFRLLVLVISTTILVITAALCLTLTWRQSNSIVSSTREKSDASFNVLYDAALSTASDVNERWVLSTAASILTDLSSSTEVIPRTLKVTRRVIERYNTDDSLLSLLPTLSALLSSSDLSQIYYMERTSGRTIGVLHPSYRSFNNMSGYPEYVQNMQFLLYSDGTTRREHGIVDKNPDALYATLCALGADYRCNNTVDLSVPIDTGASNLSYSEDISGFPWVLNWDTESPFYYKGAQAFSSEDNVYWAPLSPIDSYLTAAANVLFYDPTNKSNAFALAFTIRDFRQVSAQLKRLVVGNGQRIYMVTTRSTIISHGSLVGASHGDINKYSIVNSTYTMRPSLSPIPIVATESDDRLIREVSNALLRTHGLWMNVPLGKILSVRVDGLAALEFGSDHFVYAFSIDDEATLLDGLITIVVIPRELTLGPTDAQYDHVLHRWEESKTELDDENRKLFIRTTLILLGFFILVLLVSSFMLTRLTDPLRRLREEMAAVAVMNFDTFPLTPLSESTVSWVWEMRSMQESFLTMVSSLKELRSYMPQEVLAPAHDGPLEPTLRSSIDITDRLHPLLGPPDSVATTASTTPKGSESTPPNSAPTDLISRLREARFRSFDATVMTASMPNSKSNEMDMDETYSAIHAFVSTVVECVALHGGVVHSVTATSIISAWNTSHHTHNPEYEALVAAQQLRNSLNDHGFLGCRIVVSSGPVMLGFVGTSRMRSPVITGRAIDVVSALTSLANSISSGILVEERVAQRARARVCLLPVDHIALRAAMVSGESSPQQNLTTNYEMVYEVLPDVSADDEVIAQRHTDAFSSYLRLDFQSALTKWSEVVRSFGVDETTASPSMRFIDHVLRLSRNCVFFLREPTLPSHFKVPLQRRQRHEWDFWERYSGVVDLPESFGPLSSRRKRRSVNFLSHTEGTQSPRAHQSGDIVAMSPRTTTIDPSDLRERVDAVRDMMQSTESDSDFESNDDTQSELMISRQTTSLAVVLPQNMDLDVTPLNTPKRSPRSVIVQSRSPRVATAKSAQAVFVEPNTTAARHESDKYLSLKSTNMTTITFESIGGGKYHASSKVLGTGATSQVRLAMSDDGALVALKCCKIPSDNRRRKSGAKFGAPVVKRDEVESVIEEINMLSMLRHENIVAYLGASVHKGELIIVTEFVSGGSLAGALETFGTIPIRSFKRYLRDILHGLAYLHQNDIAHRDVKPHNVLLMIDGQCKLTDFGASAKLAKFADDENKDNNNSEDEPAGSDIIGTAMYMAPEAAKGHATRSSDIWSLGVMAIELLTGTIPYSEERRSMNFWRFIYSLSREEGFGPTLPPVGGDITDVAIDFFSSCLTRDPTARPTATELLAHAFLM